MYKVFVKKKGEVEQVLHSSLGSSKLVRGVIKKGLNTFSSFEFEVNPKNPFFANMPPLTTRIRVYDELANKDVFIGRIVSEESKMDTEGLVFFEYTCADDLSYLQDSIQTFEKVQNTTPEQYLGRLLNCHNSQVEEHKKIYIGRVNVTNSTDNVYRYTDDASSTWMNIVEKLTSRIGGELQIRRVNEVNYLDYLVEIGEKTNVSIELGKNLLSNSRNVDTFPVITRLFPRGARIDPPEGATDASYPRVTIAQVNGGKEYIDASSDMIAQFGYKSGVEVFEDTNQPSILLTKGKNWLNAQKPVKISNSVQAVDLSILHLDSKKFEVGNYYRINNKLLGLDEDARITELQFDIIEPQLSSFGLGDRMATLSTYQTDANKIKHSVAAIRANSEVSEKKLEIVNQNAIEALGMTATLEKQLGDTDEKMQLVSEKTNDLEIQLEVTNQTVIETAEKASELDIQMELVKKRLDELEN